MSSALRDSVNLSRRLPPNTEDRQGVPPQKNFRMDPSREKDPAYGKGLSKFLQQRPATERSPWTQHFIAATGEFVGTFMFLFLAYLGHLMSVAQAPDTGPNGTNSNQTVIFISMSYGFALLVTAWTMYRVSGGLFNPAVTFGMVITGALPRMRGLVLFPAQIVGAICAAAVVSGIVPGDIRLVETTLSPQMSSAQGVFLEMFLTAMLVFTVLMLAAEKSKDTFIAPIGIGIALFISEIAGVFYTGASLNPARSFAPCVVGANFQHYHWIYWIGPFLGALLAAGYYDFIKFFNYEDANPGQDASEAGSDAGDDDNSRETGVARPASRNGRDNGAIV